MAVDVIVIGSGFGGAITACRLAQAGMSVLVLERGRRWQTQYPRKPGDAWLWDAADPAAGNGWLDLRRFPHMAVAQGAGVGGGSLIYANVSCEAPERVFDRGWPAPISYAGLKPHYDRVARVMNVQPVPAGQETNRMLLMREAADKIGQARRYRKLDLAVTFDPDLPRACIGQDPATVPQVPNEHGALQGHCVHCGDCDIGCIARAKNTLDLNYLYLAENKFGARIRELHLVRRIEPDEGGGYRVTFDDLSANAQGTGSETARIVIVAAGSLGSTELLLRARDVHGTLPAIGARLGEGWSSNGDFLTPAFYTDRAVNAHVGPTIGSAIDFEDGSVDGQSFWIQDGGIPSLAIAYLRSRIDDPATDAKTRLLLAALERWITADDPLRAVMPWFAQGVDAGDGKLWMTADGTLRLDWHVAGSKPLIDTIVDMHKRLSHVTGGTPVVPPSWTLFRDLVTPHPLGGCNMGTSADDGVVDGFGEVFGYPNLYVADGAIVPRPLGVNPSRTIGALAEHVAAGILRRQGKAPVRP